MDNPNRVLSEEEVAAALDHVRVEMRAAVAAAPLGGSFRQMLESWIVAVDDAREALAEATRTGRRQGLDEAIQMLNKAAFSDDGDWLVIADELEVELQRLRDASPQTGTTEGGQK